MIADKVAEADVGLEIEVYPGQSLFKAREQWATLSRGRLDITALPLDYASGRHPEFSATLMPGLVRNHEHAQRLNDSEFMGMIKEVINESGALFVAGVLAICHMVFVRYALGMSTSWQTEFTIFSVTGAMLMGSAYVLMTGGHVAITLLPDALGGMARRVMWWVASLFGFAFCAALAYGSWVYVAEAFHGQWTTGTVWNPPLWPALLPVALGATLLTLQYVAEMLREES